MDIFLLGTTVTQGIVYLLVHKLDFKTCHEKNMDERFPFLDQYDPNMRHFRGLQFIENLPSPRLIKSHLHYHVLPDTLFKSNCKVLPRPVIVLNYTFGARK